MTEPETNLDKPIRKSSSHREGISKWYTIFAVFLALNFCGLSYAYWVKFYKNKKLADNSKQADSLLANVIVLPNDTIYVDKADLDTLDNEVADEPDTDKAADTDTKETSAVFKPSYNSQTFQISKTTAASGTSTAIENKKAIASTITKPPVHDKAIGKTEEESHTFLVSLGMFKSKSNALNLMSELKQKGIEGEIEESDHFSKMAPGYILVLAGMELSSATAYQIGAEMKKKGLDCFVKDAGKYSWR